LTERTLFKWLFLNSLCQVKRSSMPLIWNISKTNITVYIRLLEHQHNKYYSSTQRDTPPIYRMFRLNLQKSNFCTIFRAPKDKCVLVRVTGRVRVRVRFRVRVRPWRARTLMLHHSRATGKLITTVPALYHRRHLLWRLCSVQASNLYSVQASKRLV
jgi:hypothetical protein